MLASRCDDIAPMKKRARVMAALRGEAVDRVPLSFWLHNFATENAIDSFVAESLRLARTFDWDYLKPQSRAQCFAEAWGFRFEGSGERATPFAPTHAPCAGADDLSRLQPANPSAGALGEQLEALRRIRAGVGEDPPIIWTVFSPMMVVPYLLGGGVEQALAIAREEPKALEAALDAIAYTLAGYARLAVAAGADGLFYATNVARRGLLTAEECRRFQRPYDLRVLAAVASAPFTALHVCGAGVHFDEFVDYPAQAFSWALGDGNPSLREAHRRTGRAVMGGLPAKPVIASLTPAVIAERTRAALGEMNGRALLLGPDCSINPDTPEALLHAARAALEQAPAA
jgi:uroporphyrinogen decarboxylase